jgi:hypothetical protein
LHGIDRSLLFIGGSSLRCSSSPERLQLHTASQRPKLTFQQKSLSDTVAVRMILAFRRLAGKGLCVFRPLYLYHNRQLSFDKQQLGSDGHSGFCLANFKITR